MNLGPVVTKLWSLVDAYYHDSWDGVTASDIVDMELVLDRFAVKHGYWNYDALWHDVEQRTSRKWAFFNMP